MPYFNIPERRVGSASVRVSPEDMGAGIAVAGVSQQVGQNISKGLGYLKEKQNKIDALNQSITASKFKSGLSADISSLEAEYNKRGGDPSGFADEADTQIEEKFEALKESVAPSQRLELEAKLLPYIEKQKAFARSVEANLSSIYTVGQATENLDVVQNQILKGEMDVDDALDIVEDATAAIRELDPKAAATYRSSGLDSVLSSEFQRVAQQYGADVAIDQYENTDKFDEMDPAVAQRLIASAKSTGKSEVREALSFARQQVVQGNAAPAELAKASETAKNLGLTAEAEEAEKLLMVSEDSYAYGQMSLPNRAKAREALEAKAKTDGLTEEEALRLSAYQSHDVYASRMMKDDQWKYARTMSPEIAEMDEFPVRPDETQDIAKSVSSRQADRQKVEDRYGTRPPFYTNEELTLIKSEYDSRSTKDKAAYLQYLATVTPPQEFGPTAALLNEKDERLAGDFAMSRVRPDLVARSLAFRDAPIDIPAKSEWEGEMLKYSSAGATANVTNNIMAYAQDLYKYHKSMSPSLTKNEAMKLAIDEAGGPTVDMKNGTTSVSFINTQGQYIPAKDMILALDNMELEDLKKVDIRKSDGSRLNTTPMFNGRALDIRTVREWAQVVPKNSTQFFLRKKGTQESFYNASGEPLVLDMSQLSAIVGSRLAAKFATRGTRKQRELSQ